MDTLRVVFIVIGVQVIEVVILLLGFTWLVSIVNRMEATEEAEIRRDQQDSPPL